jgi:hypothetical protein
MAEIDAPQTIHVLGFAGSLRLGSYLCCARRGSWPHRA